MRTERPGFRVPRRSRVRLGIALALLAAAAACSEQAEPPAREAAEAVLPAPPLAAGTHRFASRNALSLDLGARPRAQLPGPRRPLEVRAPSVGRAAWHAYWSFWLTLAPGEGERIASAHMDTIRLPAVKPFQSQPLRFAISVPERDGVWDQPGGLAFRDDVAWAIRVSDGEGVLMDAAHPPDPSNEEWRLYGGDWGPVQEWQVEGEREPGPLRAIELHVARRDKAGERAGQVSVRVTDAAGRDLLARSLPKAWNEVDPDGFDGTHEFQRFEFRGDFRPERGVRYLAWLDHEGWDDEEKPVLAPRAWVLKRGKGPREHRVRAALWSKRIGIGRGRYLFTSQVPFAIGSSIVALDVDAQTSRFEIAKLVREWVDSPGYAEAWEAGEQSGAVFVVRFAPAAGAHAVAHRFASAADLTLELR